MAMPSFIQPSIDYKKVGTVPSKYKLMRVPLRNSPSTIGVTNTSNVQVEFLMPSGSVFNLSRSYIAYELAVGAQGGGISSFLHEDVLECVQNAYFGNNSSVALVDLQFVNNLSKLLRPMSCGSTKLISSTVTDGYYPSMSTTTGVKGNVLAAPYTVQTGGSVFGQNNGATASDTALSAIVAQHLSVSPANTAVSKFRMVRFDDVFTNTLFGMDKDLYFGVVDMFLRLTLASGQKVGFAGTNPADPTVGAADLTLANIDTVTNVAYAIRNMVLWLAVEQNELIVDSVKAKYNSPTGLTMQIPVIVAQRTSSSGTSANFQYTLNQTNGKRLRSIIWSVWNSTERSNTAYDCQNWNGSKVATYNTYLNSNPLQIQSLSCAQATALGLVNSDDWLQNRSYLDGSCISNQGLYQLLWHHQDRFSEKTDQKDLDDKLEDGLSLSNSSNLWSVQSTTANANLIHYIYFVYLRDVSISADRIAFV